ncbi:MAG: AtpZ/AtpI family protein [Deltaproteobacteria bacterium]
MDRDSRKEMMKLMAEFGTIGGTVAFSIFIGIWIGYFLDHKVFGGRTTPWFTLIFLVLGIIAAFKNLWNFIQKNMEKENEEDKENKDEK